MSGKSAHLPRKLRLIMELRRTGISDARVLGAAARRERQERDVRHVLREQPVAIRCEAAQLGELLGRITRHLLLMTATPHSGKPEDFQLFMALIDPDRPFQLSDKADRSGRSLVASSRSSLPDRLLPRPVGPSPFGAGPRVSG